jgi:ABC-type nitrate/sulfonate/bicarbonate transport system substrate-binding protein
MKKILAALFMYFAFQTSVRAEDKIRIGVPPSGGHIMLPLAQNKGFLKYEGLDAGIIRIAGGVATAALVNDQINYFTALTFPVRGAIQAD